MKIILLVWSWHSRSWHMLL